MSEVKRPRRVLNEEDESTDMETEMLEIPESPELMITNPIYMIKRSNVTGLDFEILVHQKYYVDKTNFIEKVLDLLHWAIVIFQRRNSMKTTHLKALRSYCDFASTMDFSNFNVGLIEKYYRQFCVLFLSFNVSYDKVDSREALENCIKQILINGTRNYFRNHLDAGQSLNEIEEIVSRVDKESIGNLISTVCYEIFAKFEKKVILLVDNMDVPFLALNPEIAEMAFKNLFNPVTSDHPQCIQKLIMMGTVIPKIFFKGSSFGSEIRCDHPYAVNSLEKHFWFTENEVVHLLEKYNYPNTAIDLLRKRYGGYKLYDSTSMMFNSFSIVQFVFQNPVFNLSTNSDVGILWSCFHSRDVLHASDPIRISKAEKLLWWQLETFTEYRIKISSNCELDYAKFYTDISMGMLFMLYGGYLTLVKVDDNNFILSLPNEEIQSILMSRRNHFLPMEINYNCIEEMNKAFNSCTDTKSGEDAYSDFCSLVTQTLIKCSCKTFKEELAYHVFLLILFHSNVDSKLLLTNQKPD